MQMVFCCLSTCFCIHKFVIYLHSEAIVISTSVPLAIIKYCIVVLMISKHGLMIDRYKHIPSLLFGIPFCHGRIIISASFWRKPTAYSCSSCITLHCLKEVQSSRQKSMAPNEVQVFICFHMFEFYVSSTAWSSMKTEPGSIVLPKWVVKPEN